MIRSLTIKIALSVLLSLMLSSCGFHLRKAPKFPLLMQDTWIQSPSTYGPLTSALKRQLKANGLSLVNTQGAASAILRIKRNTLKKHVFSVDSNARVREFELQLQVTFDVIAADGTELISEKQEYLAREFSFDEDQVLGKSREEELIRADMYQDMVRKIMMSLSL